jgi:hypothetical protein
VEQPVERRAQHAGHEAAGEAPGQHRPGRGHGEQVGREGGHGEPPEGGDEHRGHADLGGGAHRERFGHGTGAGQPLGQWAGQQGDAQGGAHGQLEPERARQERVDEEQAGDGEGEDPCARGRATHRVGGGHHGGHRRGPQHRRLEAGQQREEGEDAEGDGPPWAQAQAAQQRPAEDEDEGDVLAGHGEQVGQACGPEVVGHLHRLAAVVAEHHAGEQRPPVVAERFGPPGEGPAQRVGEPARQRPLPPRTRLAHVEPGADVAAGQEVAHDRRRRPQASLHHQALPCEPRAQRARRGAGRPRLRPPAAEPDLGADGPADAVDRIGQQRDLGPHGARLGRDQAGLGSGGEARSEDGGPDHEQPRAPDHQRYRHHDEPGRRRHRHRDGTGDPDRGGQRHDGALAEGAGAGGDVHGLLPDDGFDGGSARGDGTDGV